MEINDRNQLKEYFKTNKRPTESNFGDLIDSVALKSEAAPIENKPYKVFSAMLSVENNSLDPFNPNYIITHTLLEENTIGELNFEFGRGNEIIISDLSGENRLTFERRLIILGTIREDFNFSSITESARISDDSIRLKFTIKEDDVTLPDPTARPEFYNLPIEIKVFDEFPFLIETDSKLERYRNYLKTSDLIKDQNLLIPPYRFVSPDGRRNNEHNGSNKDEDLEIYKKMPDRYLILPEINTDGDKNPHTYNLRTKEFACYYTYLKNWVNDIPSDSFLRNSVKKARKTEASECIINFGNNPAENNIETLKIALLSGNDNGIKRISLIVNDEITHYTREEILLL
ncbi:hypothetical protein [Epilithonimonas arachidiradicis]|uniref:Uncharacterized protein n=3 Tax=Epilithonimonas arachidiradicis TaxID=1617282 RepID=A0A420CMM1_9FLAO|nr:hypothetical protein [Epilithonimonas arachidiradicis]RKE79645.1 hypothetical protein BXY58_3303 [Epilithonimonas arachidiradicis]